MADIRNYMKEREKREKQAKQEQQEETAVTYKEKIRKHKLTLVYRILLIVLIVGAVGALVLVQYIRHVYTSYETVSSINIQEIRGTTHLPFAGNILTYSKDGVHYSDGKGDVKWNLSYEMQNPMVEICQDIVAIADYNGRTIYVSNTSGALGEIQTNMPIRNLCVSATGLVVAVLEDTDITWIYLYDSQGNVIATSKTTMQDYGYPVALNVSPNGVLMMVSFLYADTGSIKTSIAFFNFDEVGKSQLDNLVSGYNYKDSVIPYVQFMDNNTSFAVGDDRIIFYQGANKPEFVADNLFDRQVQGVYYNENYAGLVFLNDTGDSRYQFVIYDKSGNKTASFDFDMEYTDIFFDKDTFVIYNETECMIHTIKGREKYTGMFEKPVQLMVPTSKAYRYSIVTQDSIDTIALQ